MSRIWLRQWNGVTLVSSMKVDDLFYRLSRSPLPRQILTLLVRSYLRYFPGSAGKERLWNRVVLTGH
jgi:hypothetical protein